MKKIITLILLTASFEAFATGGSIYTRYGLGDMTFGNSARKLSLGSIGSSVMQPNFINPNNPASLTKINQTRFESGLTFSNISMQDKSGDDRQTNFNFQGFSLAFPIQRDYGITLAAGLVPLTNIDYSVSSPINNPDTGFVNSKLNTVLSGKGGLSKFYIGLSYNFYDISFGLSFDYYTGKNEYISTLDFSNNFDYLDVSFTQRNNFSGLGTTFGLISPDLSNFIRLGNSISNLRVGMTLSFSGELNTDTSLVKKTYIGELVTLNGKAKTKLPYSFSLGTSFNLNKEYFIVLDYFYQPWSQYKFNNKLNKNLTDLNKFTMAVEYQNSDKRIASSFWNQVELRGGLNFEQTQYKIQNKNINSYSVFGGISLPLGVGNTIDISLEYGIRGERTSGLVKENFINSIISISLGELWFFRPER
jgi:hypothetical protein